MTNEKQFRTILTKYTLCHKIENSFATALNHSLAITVISQYNITEITVLGKLFTPIVPLFTKL